MRMRDLIFADALDSALAMMGLPWRFSGFWRGHIAHPFRGTFEARFGVDQELARDNDFLSGFKPFADLGLTVGFDPELHIGRCEFAIALRDHDDAAPSGLDHRFRRPHL